MRVSVSESNVCAFWRMMSVTFFHLSSCSGVILSLLRSSLIRASTRLLWEPFAWAFDEAVVLDDGEFAAKCCACLSLLAIDDIVDGVGLLASMLFFGAVFACAAALDCVLVAEL